jgi:hypothetical protein
MKSRRSWIKFTLISLAVGLTGLFVARVVQEEFALINLGNLDDGKWQVNIHRTRPLPGWIESPVNALIDYAIKDPTLRTIPKETWKRRLEPIFGGVIHELEIIGRHKRNPDEMHPKDARQLALALQRLPYVRKLKVMGDMFAEEDWTQVCQAVRDLPKLQELTLYGWCLSDKAIAPLAGHDKLKEILMAEACVTPDSATTFATMPSLTLLRFGTGYNWFTYEKLRAVSDALHPVAVEFDYEENPFR